jgi:hypothetical protein
MTMATSSTATQAMTRTDPSEDLLPSAAIGATCLRLTLALCWLIHWWFKAGVSGMERPRLSSWLTAGCQHGSPGLTSVSRFSSWCV